MFLANNLLHVDEVGATRAFGTLVARFVGKLGRSVNPAREGTDTNSNSGPKLPNNLPMNSAYECLQFT